VYPIDWEALRKEACKSGLNANGFNFGGQLFLSPRDDQKMRVISQATLNTALDDIRGTEVICTTYPVVDADTRMSDAPTIAEPEVKTEAPLPNVAETAVEEGGEG